MHGEHDIFRPTHSGEKIADDGNFFSSHISSIGHFEGNVFGYACISG